MNERRLANYDQSTKHHFGANFDIRSMIGCQIKQTRYRTIHNSQRPVSSTSEPRNFRHISRLHEYRFSPSNFDVLCLCRVTSILVTYVKTNETHLSPISCMTVLASTTQIWESKILYLNQKPNVSYSKSYFERMKHMIKLKKYLNHFDKITTGHTFLQYVKIYYY